MTIADIREALRPNDQRYQFQMSFLRTRDMAVSTLKE